MKESNVTTHIWKYFSQFIGWEVMLLVQHLAENGFT